MPKFIQLTDVHLMPPGGALFDTDPEVRLRQALRDIRANQADAEWLIFSGDLTHRGEPEAYALLRDILDQETVIPYRLMIGNHDNRDNFRSIFPDQPVDDNGFVQSVIDYDSCRLIMLDTVEHGKHTGHMDEARLSWLKDRLAEALDKPVYLFFHHPPFDIGMGVDRIRMVDDEPLLAVLKTHPAIRHMYFGHVHRPIAGSWHGISMSMSYGLNHQAGLNLSGMKHPDRSGPAEYAVTLADGPTTVVHFHDFLYLYPEIITPGMGGGGGFKRTMAENMPVKSEA
jgi:3',5'-cyclic AMP phosphodiesterase CpdA